MWAAPSDRLLPGGPMRTIHATQYRQPDELRRAMTERTHRINRSTASLTAAGFLLALAALAGCGTAGASTSGLTAPAVTHSASAPAAVTTATPVPAKTVIVEVPAPASTVYQPAAAPSAPALTNCNGGTGTMYTVFAGADTSCPFAMAVADAWPGYNGTAEVYSTVTGQSYLMTYTQQAGYVTATGGNDAYVQF
jgi:hypothetical protein